MLIGEKGLSPTSDTRLKNDENSALNQLYTAAASGVKVIEDFQKFHDELKEVSDVLDAAGCKSVIHLLYNENDNISAGFSVVSFGGEFKVRPSASGGIVVGEDGGFLRKSGTHTKDGALTILLSPVLDALTVSDKNKIALYKKSQETKKMTEQELFIHSSGATAVARANQP